MEAELSDWLITETAQGNKRKRVEELFNNYSHVEVKVKRGKFTTLCGPEVDVNQLELDLMNEYMVACDCDGISELCSSDSKAVNGHAYVAYQIPMENVEQQQLDEKVVNPSLANPPSVATATAENSHGEISPAQSDHNEQQQQKQDGRIVNQIPRSPPTPPSVATSTAESSRDPISPAQRYHNEPHDREVTTEKPNKHFIDEMDVDKYVWHYMLFKYAESIKDLASEHFCDLSLRRTSVYANGKVQCRLQVKASTPTGLSSAYDKLAEMVVKLTDADVTQQTVELCPKEYFDELKQELAKKEIVLMPSACHVVGPASALEAAQSIVRAAVDKIFARKSPPFAVSIDDSSSDIFQFHIPLVGLTVHVRQGVLHLFFSITYLLTYYTDIYSSERNVKTNSERDGNIHCEAINCTFLTRCMQCRRGLAMRILSVRPSVRHTRAL